MREEAAPPAAPAAAAPPSLARAGTRTRAAAAPAGPALASVLERGYAAHARGRDAPQGWAEAEEDAEMQAVLLRSLQEQRSSQRLGEGGAGTDDGGGETREV